MKVATIIPAIIPDTYDRLESSLREVLHVAHRVQIDVMDGTYTPSVSWPYSTVDREVFESIRREDQGLPYWQDFDFEIDLMVQDPERRIEEWALAGATSVIVHVESTQKLDDIFSYCGDRRIEVALALKPSTDISVLAPYIDQAIFIQCMGNDRIGYHAVKLDPSVYEKIRAIKTQWPATVVGVDIGVSETTIPALFEAGASRFASGSAIFDRHDAKDAVVRLEALVAQLESEVSVKKNTAQ
jgi:ribulose-phosphate 3-epimerase